MESTLTTTTPALIFARIRVNAVLSRFVMLVVVLAFALAFARPAEAVRLKDIASFGGVRNNQLIGYGLVVGLGGTGDSKDNFTTTSMVNMMERMGVAIDPNGMRARNVASVMVTASLPVSAKAGSSVDITVSSIGSASSLQGGVLLQTPLKGIDGKVYALGQGALIVGGYSSEGNSGSSSKKNTTTVASIPGGAIVEREVPFEFNMQDELTIHMNLADFSTTQQVVERLNQSLGGSFAAAPDISTVRVQIPPAFQGNLVPLLASVENLEITPEQRARVVVDEKTGTIVIGRDVRISRVAVAHGGLQVTVQEGTAVSQPGGFSMGTTVASPVTNMETREESRNLNVMEGATLQELVDGLNSIGASPRDLISILKSLKASGALYADLEVI